MIRIIGASHVLEWGVGSVLINRYDELLIGDVFPSLDFRRLGDFLKWSVGCVEGGSFPVFGGAGLSPVFLVEEVESFPVFVGAGLPNIFLGDGSWTEESFPVFHGVGLSLVFLEDERRGKSFHVFDGSDRHISSPLNKTDSKKCLRFQ